MTTCPFGLAPVGIGNSSREHLNQGACPCKVPDNRLESGRERRCAAKWSPKMKLPAADRMCGAPYPALNRPMLLLWVWLMKTRIRSASTLWRSRSLSI